MGDGGCEGCAEGSTSNVARVTKRSLVLPDRGTLLVSTDLHGNLEDFLALKAEGLEVAYDAVRADFSGLSSRAKADGLHITDVLHEAVIKVSEGGTEAAGATAVIIGRETAAPAARPLALDRAFVFVLRDRATGVVLFLGHVVDPR
jgi:serine protease inhibitor